MRCGPMTETVIERDGVPIRRFVCGCGGYEGAIPLQMWTDLEARPRGPAYLAAKREWIATRLDELHARAEGSQ